MYWAPVGPWSNSVVGPRHGRKGVNLPELNLWHTWKREEYETLNRTSGTIQIPSESGRAAKGHVSAAHGHPNFDEARTGITRLPREIMDIILSYLDLESEISLKLSCRYLYNSCGAESAFSLIYKMRIDPDPSVRLAWRLIPEWFPPSTHKPLKTLFCSGCEVRHCRNMFSEEQAMRLPTHRLCLGRLIRHCVSYDDSAVCGKSFCEICRPGLHAEQT